MSAEDDKSGEAGGAVPATQKASWAQFIKSIASFSGDLSSMTAPPFILSPISLTEFPAYWGEHPELFAAIADGKTEEDRVAAVTKWFISTLRGQYTTRNDTMGSEKKPLNPVLGELFFGQWPDPNGKRGVQTLVVEQVSHHPPITAYFMENATKGITLQGHNAQKTSFSSGAIIVRQIGHAVLSVKLPTGTVEKYLINLPKLRIDGIWYGAPYIELTDSTNISSSTGWTVNLVYSGKGYFSGKAHTIKAQLFPPHSHSAKHTIDGQWNTVTKDKHGAKFTDVTGPKEVINVKAMEEMGPWESRKLWAKVAKGIREGDYETASAEKTRIENEQRQRRRDEVAAGKQWELRYFTRIAHDPDYETLGELFNANPPVEDAYVYSPKPNPNAAA